MARVSNYGVKRIKEFEGCPRDSKGRIAAYQDCVGEWTIGWGITSHDISITGCKIVKGMVISEETAEKWLIDALNKKYLPDVMKYNHIYKWTSREIDALVSFHYNLGKIAQLTADGTRSRDMIRNKLTQYNKADGVFNKGLYSRRTQELAIFNQGKKVYDGPTPKTPARGYFQLADKGDQVKELQKLYQYHDLYEGEVDGIYGPMMEAATKQVQKIVGTKENGKCGNKVLPYLMGKKR